jgi:hypothetical protein
VQSQQYLTFPSLKVIWVCFISTVLSQVMLSNVYCKNHKKYMDTLCGQNAVCVGMLKQVVHIVTADLQGWYYRRRYFCSKYVCVRRWLPSPPFSPYTLPNCGFVRAVYLQPTVLYYFPPFYVKNSADCLRMCVRVRTQICACMREFTAHPLPPSQTSWSTRQIFIDLLCVHCSHQKALCYSALISHHG